MYFYASIFRLKGDKCKKVITYGVLAGLLTNVILFMIKEEATDNKIYIFNGLIWFMSFIIHKYSWNYLEGNKQSESYFKNLLLTTIFLSLSILSDNILAISVFLFVANLLFSNLMKHKTSLKGALIGANYFLLLSLFSHLCILIASCIFKFSLNTFAINEIIKHSFNNSNIITIALAFITLGAIAQASLWPFHKYLLSSLNSMTTVSAFMHAGLINAGGILIIKLYPLFEQSSVNLNFLFIFGLISVVVGTLLKLVQSSVKKILASSTIAQLGFMFMQLGLGLYAAAFLHILFHSLFKGYLFLNSNNLNEGKVNKEFGQLTFKRITFALLISVSATIIFANQSSYDLFFENTSSIQTLIIFITAFHLSLGWIENNNLVFSSLVSALKIMPLAGFYGFFIHVLETNLLNTNIITTTPINNVHWIFTTLIVIFTPLVNFRLFEKNEVLKKLYDRMWVIIINMGASKPKSSTPLRADINL
jgi:NAD(P)H-quinone oxidoreductase subunit 5